MLAPSTLMMWCGPCAVRMNVCAVPMDTTGFLWYLVPMIRVTSCRRLLSEATWCVGQWGGGWHRSLEVCALAVLVCLMPSLMPSRSTCMGLWWHLWSRSCTLSPRHTYDLHMCSSVTCCGVEGWCVRASRSSAGVVVLPLDSGHKRLGVMMQRHHVARPNRLLCPTVGVVV